MNSNQNYPSDVFWPHMISIDGVGRLREPQSPRTASPESVETGFVISVTKKTLLDKTRPPMPRQSFEKGKGQFPSVVHYNITLRPGPLHVYLQGCPDISRLSYSRDLGCRQTVRWWSCLAPQYSKRNLGKWRLSSTRELFVRSSPEDT